jgi:hypothetical protein
MVHDDVTGKVQRPHRTLIRRPADAARQSASTRMRKLAIAAAAAPDDAHPFQRSSAATSKPPPNMAEDVADSPLRQSPDWGIHQPGGNCMQAEGLAAT